VQLSNTFRFTKVWAGTPSEASEKKESDLRGTPGVASFGKVEFVLSGNTSGVGSKEDGGGGTAQRNNFQFSVPASGSNNDGGMAQAQRNFPPLEPWALDDLETTSSLGGSEHDEFLFDDDDDDDNDGGEEEEGEDEDDEDDHSTFGDPLSGGRGPCDPFVEYAGRVANEAAAARSRPPKNARDLSKRLKKTLGHSRGGIGSARGPSSPPSYNSYTARGVGGAASVASLSSASSSSTIKRSLIHREKFISSQDARRGVIRSCGGWPQTSMSITSAAALRSRSHPTTPAFEGQNDSSFSCSQSTTAAKEGPVLPDARPMRLGQLLRREETADAAKCQPPIMLLTQRLIKQQQEHAHQHEALSSWASRTQQQSGKMALSAGVFAGRLGRYSDNVLKPKLLGPSRADVLLEMRRAKEAAALEWARLKEEMEDEDAAEE